MATPPYVFRLASLWEHYAFHFSFPPCTKPLPYYVHPHAPPVTSLSLSPLNGSITHPPHVSLHSVLAFSRYVGSHPSHITRTVTGGSALHVSLEALGWDKLIVKQPPESHVPGNCLWRKEIRGVGGWMGGAGVGGGEEGVRLVRNHLKIAVLLSFCMGVWKEWIIQGLWLKCMWLILKEPLTFDFLDNIKSPWKSVGEESWSLTNSKNFGIIF